MRESALHGTRGTSWRHRIVEMTGRPESGPESPVYDPREHYTKYEYRVLSTSVSQLVPQGHLGAAGSPGRPSRDPPRHRASPRARHRPDRCGPDRGPPRWQSAPERSPPRATDAARADP